jgi:predicted DNA-binding antitoxin AbrB/MazE fold protein
MSRNIEAVYEGGVLKPLSPLKLNEHQKVKITVEGGESVVRATSSMFSGPNHDNIEEMDSKEFKAKIFDKRKE